MIITLISLGQGSYLNAHFFFLGFGVILFNIFPLAQWRDTLVLFISNMGMFAVCEAGIIPANPEIQELNLTIVSFLRISNILFSIFLIAIILWISEAVNSKSDKLLETLSTTDSLTGLVNRRGFEPYFERERARCQRSKTFGALMYIDLNDFKKLNDQYGHDISDLLLQKVADQLKSAVRKTDIVARFGGDEFVVVISEVDRVEENALVKVQSSVDKIKLFLADIRILDTVFPDDSKNIQYECSASVGIITFSGDSNIKTVIREADIAMYKQKAHYRK